MLYLSCKPFGSLLTSIAQGRMLPALSAQSLALRPDYHIKQDTCRAWNAALIAALPLPGLGLLCLCKWLAAKECLA